MLTTLRFLLLTGLRDRLYLSMLVGLGLVALLGSFVGEQNVVESREAVLAYLGFAARFVVVAGIVLFVAVHVRRSFESREILILLSRPMARSRFVLTYWLGFTGIAALLAIAAALLISLIGQPDPAGLMIWTGSVALEAGIMVALALFFSLALPGVVATLACVFGFYIVARMIGVLIAIAESEYRGFTSDFARGVRDSIDVVALFVPRLDLLGQTAWLVHGVRALDQVIFLGAQSAVYAALILAAAVFDFHKRNL